MCPMTITTDYLLYDNRTRAPVFDDDWGLKVASGRLRDDKELQRAFLSYCSASTSQGSLRSFSGALGGFRPKSGGRDGYMLCATVETTDRGGRPSWAVIGFWFESLEALSQALSEADAVSVARAISDSETKPSEARFDPSLHPGRSWGAADPIHLPRYVRATVLHRFSPSQSVHQVKELYLSRLGQGMRIPDVLGIAAFRRDDPKRLSAFDLVLCTPVDENGEINLRRALSVQQERRDSESSISAPPGDSREPLHRPPVSQPEAPASARAQPQGRTPAWDGRVLVLVLAGTVLVGFLVALIPERQSAGPAKKGLRRESKQADGGEAGLPAPRGEPPVPPDDLPVAPASASLDRVVAIANRFHELQPGELESTRAFQLARNVPVVEKFQDDRRKVQEAFEQLLRTHAMVDGNIGDTLAYFVRGSGSTLPAPDRRSGIQRILADWRPDAPDCSILRNAFGFEFEDQNSVLEKWCGATEELVALAEEG